MNEITEALDALRKAIEDFDIKVSFSEAEPALLARLAESLGLTEELKEWYSIAAPLDFSLPWSVEWLILFSPQDLSASQVGYRWYDNNRTEESDLWESNWLAIGHCLGGDPIIADLSQAGTPILMALHGAGTWNAQRVAPNLASFFQILKIWVEVTSVDFPDGFETQESELVPGFKERLEERFSDFISPEEIANLMYFIDG